MLSVDIRKLFPVIKPEQFPQYVRSAIAEQEQLGRVFTAWCRLGIVIFFTMLYFFAPPVVEYHGSFPAHYNMPGLLDELLHLIRHRPVPFAIGLYFFHALISLYFAYVRHHRLLDYAEILVDFIVLYTLIWTFHLQYAQPPSFYLKAPTLLYVFIFISMHALRFEASYIVFAGASAIVGWVLMTAYAYYTEMGMTVTRSYVEYMTSNSILIGAEIDKVLVIFLVTVLLAITVNRAKQLMIAVVVEGSVARSLARFVPAQVADELVRSGSEIDTEQNRVQNATVMFTDIQGFTTYSEKHSSDEVITSLNNYFEQLYIPISAFKGVINQFQGDALLASFNVPIQDTRHATHAIKAALAINKLHDQGLVPFVTRIGLNTGDIVGGMVGTPDRLTYTVHGDSVNLAARLEQLNKKYNTRILLSESTVRQAEGEFKFRLVDEIKVRGRTQLTRIYTIEPEGV